MSKMYNEETKNKASKKLLEAEKELIYCNDLLDKFAKDSTLIPDHIEKELKERKEKAERAVKRNTNFVQKVCTERIDPTTVSSKMQENLMIIEELNKVKPTPIENIAEQKLESPISRVKSKSHNLKEIIENISREIEFNKLGIDSTDIEKGIKDKKITVSIDHKGVTKDHEIIKEYHNCLLEGKFTPEPYFTEDDGEVYWLVKNFFNPKTPEDRFAAAPYLCRFFNILNRQINNYPFNDEVFGAKKIRAAYNNGKVIKIIPALNSPVKFSIMGKGWVRNPLKEAAWAVVHSYLLDILLPENNMFKLIPKTSELVNLWNTYISRMDDVPEIVKKYFYLDDEAESIFTRNFKKSAVFTAEDNSIKGYLNDHPVDDHEPGAVPFEEAVVDSVNTIVDTVVDAAKELKNAINNDTSDKKEKDDKIIDGKFELIDISEKKDIDKKKSDKNSNNRKETKSSDEKKTEPKVIVRPDEPDQNISFNNETFEAKVQNLYRFTNMCRKLGYSVVYSNNQYYPALVQAFIFNRSNYDGDRRYTLLDPCIIYGDTLRVIYINDTEFIRTGCFVAISQKELVEKIIKGTFTKEDRKVNNDQLPKVLNDFRDRYIFIDRIDFSNLQKITFNNETKRSISFRDWKGLVVNISNILRNPDIPICRFRIVEYKDISHFKLMADSNKVNHQCTILNEESDILAKKSGFWVDYNPDAYPDSQYIYGTMKPE